MKKKCNKLEGAGKKNSFKVPEGYFEGLTDQIMNRLSEIEVKQPKLPTRWERIRPWVYMAAMFTGIALMFKVFNGDFKRSDDNLTVFGKKQQILPAETTKDTDEYLSEDIYDYLEYEAAHANYRLTVYGGEY